METNSLQNIMNEMAAHPQPMELPRATSSSSEIEIYITLDPLLADLYKQYNDAIGQYEKLVRTNGEDDPMTEIAADLVDSVYCAVETRLIELYRDEKLVQRAQTIMEQIRTQEEAESKKISVNFRKKLRQLQQLQNRQERARLIREEATDTFIILTVWILVMQAMMNRTRRVLSAARAFSMVNASERTAKAT